MDKAFGEQTPQLSGPPGSRSENTRREAIDSINDLAVYVITDPDATGWTTSESEWIEGVPLRELLDRIPEGQGLYLVDYASTPGFIKLTRLA